MHHLSLLFSLCFLSGSCSERATSRLPETQPEIVWLHDYGEARELSQTLEKPLLIEFSADWCKPCGQLRRETFVVPKVIEASKGVVALEIDTASGTATAMELVERHRVQVLPTFVVVGADGKTLPDFRRTGFISAKDFERYLRVIGHTP